MAKSWYSARRKTARNGKIVGEISIFSDIGAWGVTAHDFNASLKKLGKIDTLDIRISSNGGDVTDGFAIFNMLNRHEAHKVVTIEGLAASMASVIAMAGDEVVMPSNSFMMIHNPWGGVVGEGDQIISFGEALQKMQTAILQAYSQRTGLTDKELSAMMDKETWLSAAEAVEFGFADSVEEPVKMAASIDISKFNRAPKSFRAKLEAATMANKHPKNARPNAELDDDFEGDEAKTEAQIRAEVLAHGTEIRALCALAGLPNLADGFIAEDKSLSEVTAALTAAKVEASKAKDKNGKPMKTAASDEVSAHHSVDGNGVSREVASLDAVDVYANWNKSGKKR